MVDFKVLITLNLAYNRNKLYKTLQYRSRDMLNFDFFRKSLEIVSSPHLSCCVLVIDKISVPDFFHFLYIAIVSVPDCYVIDFETNLTFLIKPLIYLKKKSGQKIKVLENKKSIFHNF